MARKNLLSILSEPEDKAAEASTPAYPMRGASKSMIRSVSELARQADAYLEGEQVVDLDPALIDVSFVADRMEGDEEQFSELLEAIRENGQNTPILVRPHPGLDGRYMIVFGHRRARAAKHLGRKVRAVVKAIDDRTHVVAQGQENSARANLSFIEKASFAKRLADMGYGRDVICSALASNEAAVSKMISVVTRIPASVIQAIGPAPAVGRERWVALSLLANRKAEILDEAISDPGVAEIDSNERFDRIFTSLNTGAAPGRKALPRSDVRAWASPDQSISVTVAKSGKKATVTLGRPDGLRFAEFISGQLDDLYEAFRKSTKETVGD